MQMHALSSNPFVAQMFSNVFAGVHRQHDSQHPREVHEDEGLQHQRERSCRGNL